MLSPAPCPGLASLSPRPSLGLPSDSFSLASPRIALPTLILTTPRPRLGQALSSPRLASPRHASTRLASPPPSPCPAWLLFVSPCFPWLNLGLDLPPPCPRLTLTSHSHRPRLGLDSASPSTHFASASHLPRPRLDSLWTRPCHASSRTRFGLDSTCLALASACPRLRLCPALATPRPRLALGLTSASSRPRPWSHLA